MATVYFVGSEMGDDVLISIPIKHCSQFRDLAPYGKMHLRRRLRGDRYAARGFAVKEVS
jgi:hypothetical protein